MFQTLVRLICISFATAILFVPAVAEEISIEEAAAMLPDRFGDFRARGAADGGEFGPLVKAEDFGVLSQASRTYLSARGETFEVSIIKTKTDSGAYSLLTHLIPNHPSVAIKQNEVGTASLSMQGSVIFFKGSALVDVRIIQKNLNTDVSPPLDFARLVADQLDAGEGGIPVLALHLPEWEEVQGQVDYAISLPVLKRLVGNQSILDVVSFDGGAEAVTALYGDTRLVIIEFTTPQYAMENDARITQRLAELRAEVRSVPSAYRRVGNYSVFVFNAPDEAAAVGLLEQVKYEKDVRWLGDNPHIPEQVERLYRMTMTGVIVTTLKATGLAILVCLGVGGIVGGFVFLRRRTRRTATEAYTDAGGMLQLNIEDVNSPATPAKLLDEGRKR